jgi:hypothetical protein
MNSSRDWIGRLKRCADCGPIGRLSGDPDGPGLDEILRWQTREAGRPVALRYAAKFRAAFGHLMTFPETGARRSKLAHDMRIWPVTP